MKKPEKETESNRELIEALDFQRKIIDEIQSRLQEQVESGSRTNAIQYSALQWAGVSAMILGTVGTYIYMNRTTRLERIFLAHFDDFPVVFSILDHHSGPLPKAIDLYLNGHYQDAYDAFLVWEEVSPSNLCLIFYRGICALRLNKWEIASSIFEEIRTASDRPFHDAATWYAGLAYLASGILIRAVLIFESLSEGSSDYSATAREILDQLQEL